MMLLEDANDLCDFLEATRQTLPREKWAAESIRLAEIERLEGVF